MHARVNRELTRGQHRRLDGCSLRQTGCVVWDRRYLGGVSVERTVTCQDCAEPRSGVEQFDDASRPSCPRCGGTKIAVSLTITASVAFATARAGVPELSLSHSADAHARLRHLQYATNSLPDLDNSDDLDVATRHVGMALERIHELDDARRRGEWLYPSWAAADRELWEAFLGARNGAHHKNWTPIQWRSGPGPSGTFWQPNLPRINWRAQRRAYAQRLEGQRVVPSLQEISTLLDREIK